MLGYALATVLFATPAMADTERYGHMMDWGYGYGMGMFFGPVLWILILGLVVAGIIWLVRRLDHGMPEQGASNAMKELDMRLARGEIDAEDYSARKKLLSNS
ncbi:SHOCT domain-containing protein [Roseovarius sp.]|uniref:SHOCT domain-containing protein n=1 Tax=Roseovarius sp. TaxID=1486281 RepID=UPI003BAD3FC6